MLKESTATDKNFCNNSKPEGYYETWFTDFISDLRSDQIQLETGLASKKKAEFYDVVMSNDIEQIFQYNGKMSHKYITQIIIKAYLNDLFIERKTKVNKLAFDNSSTGLKVWAVIDDNDEKAEKDLYLAEAKANYYCQKFNYHLSTTIVENCDNLSVPAQFKELEIGRF